MPVESIIALHRAFILDLPSIVSSLMVMHPHLSTYSAQSNCSIRSYDPGQEISSLNTETQWLVQRWPHDQVCPKRVNSRTCVGPSRKRCFLLSLVNVNKNDLDWSSYSHELPWEERLSENTAITEGVESWWMRRWKWTLNDIVSTRNQTFNSLWTFWWWDPVMSLFWKDQFTIDFLINSEA